VGQYYYYYFEWIVKVERLLRCFIQPLFFALEQVSVGVNFKIKSGFDVHELLVGAEVVRHLRLKVFDFVLKSTDSVLDNKRYALPKTSWKRYLKSFSFATRSSFKVTHVAVE